MFIQGCLMSNSNDRLSAKIEKEVSGNEGRKKSASAKRRKKSYVLDLRVHSPASIGYFGIEGIDTAPAMVSLAKVKGLDVIALTDYYSGAFIDQVVDAAQSSPLTVIPGVNLRCVLGACNDLVLSCLFPEEFSSKDLEQFLKTLDVPESARGKSDYILKKDVAGVFALVESCGGIVIPSRMDQTPHRMMAIPKLVEEYGFRTFDLAYPDSAQYFKKNWPKIKFNLYSFSNANSLAQLGTRTAKVKLPEAGFIGVKALSQREIAP